MLPISVASSAAILGQRRRTSARPPDVTGASRIWLQMPDFQQCRPKADSETATERERLPPPRGLPAARLQRCQRRQIASLLLDHFGGPPDHILEAAQESVCHVLVSHLA